MKVYHDLVQRVLDNGVRKTVLVRILFLILQNITR